MINQDTNAEFETHLLRRNLFRDSSPIFTVFEGLEATLSDSKKKYGDKVNTLLSAWEQVTNFIPTATPEATQSLIEWAYKHTLTLVLRGEWPKLTPATRTHLCVTLQRCAKRLSQHPAAPKCSSLISLVNNPWANAGLDLILNGQPDAKHEEEFCCSEKGELLTMRLKILCEDRCEDIAVNLAAACVRTLRRSDGLRSVSDIHDVHYMMDVYIVLLYKLKRTQDIFAQLKLMDLNEGLELVQRLSGEKPTKYGQARVWRNSTKAAELVAQYLVTARMIRPIAETGANTLEQILNSWALLHSKLKDVAPTLPGMIRKLIDTAESAQHIYIFCGVLSKHFGESMKPLVIELYIRALTTDMNELESQKAKSDKEKVRETAKRLSMQFLKLSDVLVKDVGIARECVLTAFSLHPTRACFDRIKEIAVACGKAKKSGNPNDETITSTTTTTTTTTMKLESETNGMQTKDGLSPNNSTGGGTFSSSLKLSSSSSTTTTTTIRPKNSNFDFSNNFSNKNFESTDQLLKSLLSSPTKKDGDKCNQPQSQQSTDQSKSQQNDSKMNDLYFARFGEDELKKESNQTVDRSLDALILIKGDAVTGSANYDEKSAPNQVLDAEKLGLSPQLCDDLAVVLSSQRYHMLTWVLDWKELNSLCERYLENAEEMRSTNKELKYLNIDYSQFKDWPSEDDTKDVFFGIEKGYEQWVDLPSDGSEQFGSFQPAGNYKRSSARRSLDDSSDSDSGSVMPVRRSGRPRKIHRLESSESDYDSAEPKTKRYRKRKTSVTSEESDDTNTQDSQTDSLGSDGCRPKPKQTDEERLSKRNKTTKKLNSDPVSHFHVLVSKNGQQLDDASGSDVSNSDIITLFSADLDENKRETIKGSAYTATAPLIITEKRTDPAVLKSLRMFRPQNAKKPKRIQTVSAKSIKDNNNALESPTATGNKFAPMLHTLNLNPKIVLTRTDEIDKKLTQSKKQQHFAASGISSELLSMSYQKQRGGRGGAGKRNVKGGLRKSKYEFLTRAVTDSDILAKNVPGMNSLDMMVPPRVQSTVNVVQLSRNITQTSNNNNRTTSNVGAQLPGTPSSGGHDSGVGMSPAGQTTSSLHDVGEEANQLAEASPTDSNNTNLEADSPRTLGRRSNRSQSPTDGASPSANATSTAAGNDQIQIVCKPDGTYHITPITTGRNVLTLQNIEEGFPRHAQQTQSSTFERLNPMKTMAQSTGLPKFQHAFGKTIYTPTTETTTIAVASTTDTIAQTKTTNMSKAVQTANQSASGIVQSIPNNIPSLQVSGNRQILGIVQSSSTAGTSVASPAVSQTLTQLVQTMHNSSPGVIYTHKIPVTISTTNPSQLNIIPAISHANSAIAGNRTPVVKLNIIRTPIRQQISAGAIQAVLTAPRLQQPATQSAAGQTQHQTTTAQSQHQPTASQTQHQPTSSQTTPSGNLNATVRPETLLNAPIEVTNQVSSTTLEQLREFESVLEQVKERSTIQPQLSQSTAQTQTAQAPATKTPNTVANLGQSLIIPSQSTTTTEFQPSNGNVGNVANAVAFQQQDGSQIFQQKVSLYVNQTTGPKITTPAPVVVVTSYCQPSASPALSVTSQSSSSPCVTPAPAPAPSVGKTTPAPSPKAAKKAASKTVKTSTTNTSKVSPIAKPQQKPQEDEQTTQRIYAILTEYAEQLRNSPDLNNKPAPRRRSNPPTNPSQSSKRKKSSSGKSKSAGQQSSELSPSADDLGRTMGSEDSSSGVAHTQDASPAGFSNTEEQNSANNESTPEPRNDSNDDTELTAKRRNVIFTEQNNAQPRAVIVQEAVPTSVSDALASVTGKMTSTAAVLVPGTNYLLPMNLMKSGQQFTIVSSGSKLLATGPVTVRSAGASGVSNALVLQSFLNQGNKIISQPQAKQVKLPALQNLPGTNQSAILMQNNAQFASEDADKTTNSEVKTENTTANLSAETTTSTNAILVNKTQTINIIPRNVTEDNQQICGVITSNPARLFNSTIAKLGNSAQIKGENVVCLTTASATAASGVDKRVDTKIQEKRIPTAIALAFTTQQSEAINNNQKEIKEDVAGDTVVPAEKILSSKKRKLPDDANSNPLHSNAKIETLPSLATKPPSLPLENSSQFLTDGLKSTSTQDSTLRQSLDPLDSSCKVGNGVLCNNARLQEAWEPEHKSSPDAPWRYEPACTTSLNLESLKSFPRETSDSSESVHNVLQMMNKNQSLEMSSGHTYQTKKYFLNNSLEPFQQFSGKSQGGTKSQPNLRLDRELTTALQQRMERKAAAIERELRLQKSLSEECEDLGVDEPSTSDLFPEADLLFDTNHSPSFDHSSQDASCSQSLLGLKSYSSYNFRSQDSSSSRDNSPNERRKSQMAQRTRTLKDTAKRAKKLDEMPSATKRMHLSYDQDSSDASRLSNPEPEVKRSKRNGSKEGTPSSTVSSSKIDTELDSEGAANVNNVASSDESLTLLGGSSADVTIPSPLSSIAGPLLSTHKYTYSNKRRRPNKISRSDYMAWDSPVSERTRSSSEDEDSSLGDASQNEDNAGGGATNGLEDNATSTPSNKLKLTNHCAYLKKDKLQVNARVVLNRAEANAIFSKHMKSDFLSETHADEKMSDASDDEHNHHHHHFNESVGSRRASLRGQVKKGYACCNGSPERPKKKAPPPPLKLDHSKLKKRLTGKPLSKKR